jgi:hypothetical protein
MSLYDWVLGFSLFLSSAVYIHLGSKANKYLKPGFGNMALDPLWPFLFRAYEDGAFRYRCLGQLISVYNLFVILFVVYC